jgi:arylsulfatase
VAAFQQQPLEGNPFFIAGTSEAFRMYREGDWKIVRQNNAEWELYNLKNDPTELEDLATLEMGKYQELIRNYQALRDERKLGGK